MTRGISIAFIGIDGIGKSTLAQGLENKLRELGVETTIVSWRACLDVVPDPYPRVVLQELWLETFRCLYGGATWKSKAVDIPRDYVSWRAKGTEETLAQGVVATNQSANVLAAALVELAGNVILSAEVIEPALARGEVVIQETFPVKHVLKELLLADALIRQQKSGQSALSSVAAGITDATWSLFDSPLLQPDLVVLVDGPPERAYEWRVAQAGRIGVLEDLNVAGSQGREAFIAFQRATAAAYHAAAIERGWLVHYVDDEGRESNVSRGVALVFGDPVVEAFIEGRH